MVKREDLYYSLFERKREWEILNNKKPKNEWATQQYIQNRNNSAKLQTNGSPTLSGI
jgi:hypothetical protein